MIYLSTMVILHSYVIIWNMLNYQRGVVSKTQIPNDTYFCGWNSNQMWTVPLRVAADLIEELT